MFNYLADAAFWNITVGTFIQVASLGITLIVLVWKMSAAQTKLQDSFAEIQKISNRVEGMDKTGTIHSQLAITSGNELAKVNAAQIGVLTESQLKMGPELAAMRTDLEWIKRTMQKNGQTPHL